VTVTLHRGPVLLPSMLDVGLPQQVDHYPGTRSEPCRDARDGRTTATHGQRRRLAHGEDTWTQS
jgi:hypothetical protein